MSHAPDADGVVALGRGVVVIRWAVLAWMLALAVLGIARGEDPVVALSAVALAAAWTAWLSFADPRWTPLMLLCDLAVAAVLVVIGSRAAWLATVYPVTAALTWGVARGVAGGVTAGAALGVVSVGAGVTAADGSADMVRSLQVLRDPVYFGLAGGGIGFVSALLERSAAQVREAQAEQVRAREWAARLTERESLGRQIHDSVLQVLALVHKRGRELAADPHVDPAEVRRLADLAATQERTLRSLILRPPDGQVSEGHASLRARLDDAATAVDADVRVSVTAVGDIRLPVQHVREIGAAVDQALANIVRHAGARHAWVYAEVDDGDAIISVRDDGCGFVFDEAALRAAGKYGLLRSIRGRVEELGGALRIETAPGRGTELELRVPVMQSTTEGAARE